MTKKTKIAITALSLAVVSTLSTSLAANASYWQKRHVYGGGSKYYSNGTCYTSWDGELKAFNADITDGDDRLYWSGYACTHYDGSKRPNKVEHYNICEIDGWGTPSFSMGVGANNTTPNVSFGLGFSSADHKDVAKYDSSNSYYCNCDYSHYATIWSFSWVDLFTSGRVCHGSHWTDIHSKVDNDWVWRDDTIYY